MTQILQQLLLARMHSIWLWDFKTVILKYVKQSIGRKRIIHSLVTRPLCPVFLSARIHRVWYQARWGGSICAWNMDNGDLCGRVYINQHVQNINFSPDGQRVVSNAGDCSIRICDFNLLQNAGIAVAERGEEFTQLFALSSDGERVLELTHSSKLVLHNALNGDRISEFGAPDGVACIAIDHCGHQVSFGNEIGEIRVWGTETSSETRKCWAAHSDRVISISFSIDGTKIVSAGKDGFIRVCPVSRERQIGCIAEDHFENVAFSDDGDFVISSEAGAFHSQVKMWKWDTEELGYHSSDPVACPQGLSEEDALNVLQGCGPKSSMMWPISRERYPGDVFVERPEYCTLYFVPRKDTEGLNSGEKKFLAYLPCDSKWEFSRLQGTFVTAANRRLLICCLVQ